MNRGLVITRRRFSGGQDRLYYDSLLQLTNLSLVNDLYGSHFDGPKLCDDAVPPRLATESSSPSAWRGIRISKRPPIGPRKSIKLYWRRTDEPHLMLGVHSSALGSLTEDLYSDLKRNLREAAKEQLSVNRLLSRLHLELMSSDFSTTCHYRQDYALAMHTQSWLKFTDELRDILKLIQNCVREAVKDDAMRRKHWIRCEDYHLNRIFNAYVIACHKVREAEGSPLQHVIADYELKKLFRFWITELKYLTKAIRNWESPFSDIFFQIDQAIRTAMHTLSSAAPRPEDLSIIKATLTTLPPSECPQQQPISMPTLPLPVECGWKERVKAFLLSTITLATHRVTVTRRKANIFTLKMVPKHSSSPTRTGLTTIPECASDEEDAPAKEAPMQSPPIASLSSRLSELWASLAAEDLRPSHPTILSDAVRVRLLQFSDALNVPRAVHHSSLPLSAQDSGGVTASPPENEA